MIDPQVTLVDIINKMIVIQTYLQLARHFKHDFGYFDSYNYSYWCLGYLLAHFPYYLLVLHVYYKVKYLTKLPLSPAND